MTRRRDVLLLPLVLGAACSREKGEIALNGAGATFPYPLYTKWIAEYQALHPAVRINYQSIGSGGGVRQVVAGTVDFGATDVAVRAEEARGAAGKLLHVPTAVGSIVVSYNLSGLAAPLKLTPEILANVFSGAVTRWNARELVALNPGVALPDLPIAVVYRTDGSGTTAIFTHFLAESSALWRERIGTGKLVRWPVGFGAKGNEGVAGQLRSTPGAIAYTELAYATQSGFPRAAIRNHEGNFVVPAPPAATAAAEAVELPDELFVSLSRASGKDAYPLAAYTYLLVYQEARDHEKGQALADFLWWAIHEGQKYTQALDYAPLPRGAVTKIEAALRTLRADGKPILPGRYARR